MCHVILRRFSHHKKVYKREDSVGRTLLASKKSIGEAERQERMEGDGRFGDKGTNSTGE